MSNKKDTASEIGKVVGIAIAIFARIVLGAGFTWFYLWTLAKLGWLPF